MIFQTTKTPMLMRKTERKQKHLQLDKYPHDLHISQARIETATATTEAGSIDR